MRSGRVWLALSLWLLAGGASRALGAPARGSTRQFAGKEYVQLANWARASDFEIRWLKRDETVVLSKGSTRLQFSVDSREAQINGIVAWLSFPVVDRGGALYVSQLDLQTTLQPVLVPPENRAGSRITRICLDPGHGGKDPGYRVGSNQEKKYVLLLAQ